MSLGEYESSSDESSDKVNEMIDGLAIMDLLPSNAATYTRVCSLLDGLHESITILHKADGFPYNPSPLLKLIARTRNV